MEVKTDSEKSGCLPRRTQGGTEIEGGVRMPWEAGDIYLHTKQTKPERTSPPQGCPESLLSGSSTIRQHGTKRAEVESALCSKGNPTVAPPTFPFPDRTAQKPSSLLRPALCATLTSEEAQQGQPWVPHPPCTRTPFSQCHTHPCGGAPRCGRSHSTDRSRSCRGPR